MAKRVIDISGFWPKDDRGDMLSINKVWNDRDLNPENVGRYTLQKAREGNLQAAEIDTIDALIRTCSLWSGRDLDYQDITTGEDDD